jgi:hypothetical protein
VQKTEHVKRKFEKEKEKRELTKRQLSDAENRIEDQKEIIGNFSTIQI